MTQTFGADVSNIVREVTDDKSLAKEERKRLQIVHAAHASHSAKLVKLADKIYNLRDLTRTAPADWPLSRIQGYFVWAKQVTEGTELRRPIMNDAHNRDSGNQRQTRGHSRRPLLECAGRIPGSNIPSHPTIECIGQQAKRQAELQKTARKKQKIRTQHKI